LQNSGISLADCFGIFLSADQTGLGRSGIMSGNDPIVLKGRDDFIDS